MKINNSKGGFFNKLSLIGESNGLYKIISFESFVE